MQKMKKEQIHSAGIPQLYSKEKNSSSTRTWGLIALLVVIVFGSIIWLTGSRQIPTIIPQESILEESNVQGSLPSLRDFNEFLSSATKKDIPKIFQFEFLNFENNSTALLQGSDEEMDEISDALEKHPEVTIRLEGFSDNSGDITQNKDLAFRRALTVEEQLVARGVNPDRIDTIGNGSGNKRVLLVVTSLE
jgi:outer membrane protein OmpA-like peptidoglycan-associated protein